ncbi:RIP metalloprotease RseP [Wenzhouxiangella sp. XN79A]|uniref:RIP metalloprotease RseP n=1 Tax=Wenzhouxiangella sp. XN79A TaxID=2724193 RepID=UPI00144A9427|nr:RIP metalloprotease RseP [Wenzhouxiangella sp. XN79A]NKI35008.1 RIP metalloprotease RseP [Wenzhouxiangella sp. XN79A]
MIDVLSAIFWLVVALGLLVTFHEYGHYWVARRCGVRVLRFSIGFGRPLLRWRNKEDTEFVVAAVPLGGYVKMLDDRETPVPTAERDQAFNHKSLGQRSAIVAAGPVFNLIFAVAAFWLMFMIGIADSRPLLGPTTGLAAEAGLEEQDLIVRIDEAKVQTWTHALLALIPPALDRRAVTVEVEDAGGFRQTTELALDRLGPDFREDRTLESIGLSIWRPDLPPVIDGVTDDGPAARAGLSAGDRVLAVGDTTIDGWNALSAAIPAAAGTGAPIELRIERDGRELEVQLQPTMQDGRPIIGITPPPPDAALQADMERAFAILRFGPLEGLGRAFNETWRLTAGTLGILGRMITGQASLANLSGPITIAQMAQDSARLGISRFLFFLGLISLSLAIINLLPIPVLDGGHLLYNLIEAIKGSPVSERGQVIGQTLGLVAVVGLMSLAVFNDIVRFFQ